MDSPQVCINVDNLSSKSWIHHSRTTFQHTLPHRLKLLRVAFHPQATSRYPAPDLRQPPFFCHSQHHSNKTLLSYSSPLSIEARHPLQFLAYASQGAVDLPPHFHRCRLLFQVLRNLRIPITCQFIRRPQRIPNTAHTVIRQRNSTACHHSRICRHLGRSQQHVCHSYCNTRNYC